MSDNPHTFQPDELKALRTRLLDNLNRLEQLAFSKSLDHAKEGANLQNIRIHLNAASNLLDELGKSH